MKLLPFAVTITGAALLCSCGRQTAGTSNDDAQRIAEEQQAEALSQLHEKQAALDEKERLLDAREQQLTISPAAPAESATAPAAVASAPAEAAPSPAVYSVDASYQTFYDQLAPYGAWVAMDPYGYVWQPAATLHDLAWRPYTLGHWAYTDDGWTWMSDEPFGWITYHYGRWMRTHTLGWVWTPGDQWAPAWVSWRYGNDFVGWAPLPPEARFDGATGIRQWADSQYDLGASDYTFVPAADFGDDSMASVEVPPDQAEPIYDESNNITDIYYDSGAYAIICYGPSYDFMVSKSRRPLHPPLSIQRYGFRHDGQNGPSLSGTTLRMPAPRVVGSHGPERPRGTTDVAYDARLVTTPNTPPPHGAPVPPLYQPPVPQSAARTYAPARQAAAPVSQTGNAAPGYVATPESVQSNAPPPPGSGRRIESTPVPPETGAAPNHDLQIIQQQQGARDAERRQEDSQAAQTAADQQQRAAEQQRRAEEEQRNQEQRAEQQRADDAAREQHAAEAEAAAAREQSERAAAASVPSGSPGGRGN